MKSLRARSIRLAFSTPSLRPVLLPILASEGFLSFEVEEGHNGLPDVHDLQRSVVAKIEPLVHQVTGVEINGNVLHDLSLEMVSADDGEVVFSLTPPVGSFNGRKKSGMFLTFQAKSFGDGYSAVYLSGVELFVEGRRTKCQADRRGFTSCLDNLWFYRAEEEIRRKSDPPPVHARW